MRANTATSTDFYLYFIYRRFDDTGHEEVCYVGRGRDDRVNEHLRYLRSNSHYNHLLQKWYDEDSSAFLPAIMYSRLTNDEANSLEVQYIAEYGRFDLGLGTLANLTNGGEGTIGHVHTPESRAKMSKARAGKKRSAEAIAKTAKANIGKKRSPATCERISLAQLGKPGKPHTPESRAKISESRTGEKHPYYGKSLSPEHRAKISAANKSKNYRSTRPLGVEVGWV